MEKIKKEPRKIREEILKKTIDLLTSGHSPDEAGGLLADEIYGWLNVDRCFWVPQEQNIAEALIFELQQDITSLETHYTPEEINRLAYFDLEIHQTMIVSDVSTQQNLSPLLKEFLTACNIQAIISIPVRFLEQKTFGTLVACQFYSPRDWLSDPIDAMIILSEEVGMGMYLQETSNNLKKSLDREKVVSNLLCIISQTFDIDKILQTTANLVGEFFHADRCLVLHYNIEDYHQPIAMFKQYCRHESIEALTEEDLPIESIQKSLDSMTLMKESPDSLPQEIWQYIAKNQIKSDMGIHIMYRGIPLGLIALHQCSYKRIWAGDEVSLLQTIAMEVGGALYQAELYKKEQRAKLEAKEANQKKDQFLASMAHELRTPLHSVIASSSMMLEKMLGPLTPKQEEYMKLVNRSGEHLLAIINDLLDIAKIEAGKFILNIETINTHDFIKDSIVLMGPLLKQKNQMCCLYVDEDLPTVFDGDPVRLKQVFCNLMSNAHKFTGEDQQIELSCYKMVSPETQILEIIFAFRDKGPGISETDLQRIFNPYEQGNRHSPLNEKGTGLGLTITKKIIELHGGRLEVKTREGHGSEFLAYIPAKQNIVNATESFSGQQGSPRPLSRF